jgi:hypothetical protein
VPFLASTLHPDGDAAALLGGILRSDTRLLERRLRRRAALHARLKFRTLGMAHCEGDQPGTWVVAYVLEATAGGEDVAGERWTVMELCRRDGSRDDSQVDGAGGGQRDAGRWLYFGMTHEMPTLHDATAIVEIIQEHDPAALGMAAPAGGSGLQGRRRMFAQGPRRLGRRDSLGTAADGGREWFVDLATPEAVRRARQEAMAAAESSAGDGAGRRRRQRQGHGSSPWQAAAPEAQAVAAMTAQQGDDGVLDLDLYLEAMRRLGAPVGSV